MHNPCLMHEIQRSQDDKQEPLQKILVDGPILEQISQLRQIHSQSREHEALVDPAGTLDLKLV